MIRPLLLILFGVLLVTPASYAYTDAQAIRTIVGEASNQGYVGMIAVGEVIRRQGSLRGFYGFKSAHCNHESKRTWQLAQAAWEYSKRSNITHGANHFENIHAFGEPYWVQNSIQTFAYRDHVFYKERI